MLISITIMQQLATITLLLLLAGTNSSQAEHLPSSKLDLVKPASGQFCCFKRSFTSFGVIRVKGGSSRGNEHLLISITSDENNKVLDSAINQDSAKLELKAKHHWKKLGSIFQI